MKKTLILILVVLMALFVISAICAEGPEGNQPETPVVEQGPADTEGNEPVIIEGNEPADTEGNEPANTEGNEPADTEGNEPANTEVNEPADTEGNEPANTEGNEPANTEGNEPANTEGNEPANTEGNEPADTEGNEPADTEGNEPANTKGNEPANTEGNEPANTEVNEPVITEGNEPVITEGNEFTQTSVTAEQTPADGSAAAPVQTPTETTTDEGTEVEEKNSVIRMIVTIVGSQVSVKYDENDETTYTADGFNVTSVTCDTEDGTCPAFDEKKDLIFTGVDHKERKGNEEGISEMGLNEGQFELNIEGVKVVFIVEDGFVAVIKETAEPEVIDQTGSEPEPEGNTEEPGEEGEPKPEDQPIGTSAEEDSDYIVFRTENLTLRLIRKTAKDTEDPADNTPVTPVTNEEIGEANEDLTDGTDKETADGTTAEEPGEENNDETLTDKKTDETNDGTQNEEDKDSDDEAKDEKVEETDDELTDEEAKNKDTDEDTDAETSEESENKELTEGEDGFQTVVSGDTAAAEVTEGADPVAEEGAEEAETATAAFTLNAGMSILKDADVEGEALFTADEDTELTILSVDKETGWALVELSDGTQGYVLMPQEEAEEEEEKIPMIKEKTPVRVAADGMSLVLYTAEGEMEVTILEVDDDWYKVELDDGTVGYIFKKDMVNYEATEEVLEKKVTIFSTIHPMMEINEPIKLTSYLEGFDDCVEITYQWECDKGNGFEPVEGGTGDNYSFEATLESITWNWQLVVFYK